MTSPSIIHGFSSLKLIFLIWNHSLPYEGGRWMATCFNPARSLPTLLFCSFLFTWFFLALFILFCVTVVLCMFRLANSVIATRPMDCTLPCKSTIHNSINLLTAKSTSLRILDLHITRLIFQREEFRCYRNWSCVDTAPLGREDNC